MSVAGGDALPAAPLTGDVADRLRRSWARVQREAPVPALSAAVGRRGAVVLEYGAGVPEPGPDVQFRIGSITKTFTAVLVLQLRDAGRLRLDDPLETHLPGTPAGALTLRDLLGHASGLTREPGGDFWEAVPGVDGPRLLGGLRSEDLVLPARRAWHYSNLAFGLLGLVVERCAGGAFADVLRARLCEPLALRRTTWSPIPPNATGWRVHPFTGALREEPVSDTRAMGPAGQLWSTPADLVRWGGFLADPDEAVLRRDTVEEMTEPVTMRDPGAWTVGWGLGLQLTRRRVAGVDRVLVGHGGSMPGFGAGLAVERAGGVAVAVCGNAWAVLDGSALAADGVVAVLEGAPGVPAGWRPEPVPSGLTELTGPWYYRGAPWLGYLVSGRLHLRAAADPAGTRADSYEPVAPDRFRGTAGGNLGETLVVRRDDSGRPVLLEVATWRYVRDPDDPLGDP